MKVIIALILCSSMVLAKNAGPENKFKLMKSTSASVRRQAVRDIGRMRQPSSVKILTEALSNDPDFGVRSMAAEALGNMRSKEAVPALVKALDDKNRNVRSASIVAFGYIRDKNQCSRSDRFRGSGARVDGNTGRKKSPLKLNCRSVPGPNALFESVEAAAEGR